MLFVVHGDLQRKRTVYNFRTLSFTMTELFNHYEQQFGNISAEITARICKIPNLHGCQFRDQFRSILICHSRSFFGVGIFYLR